MKTHSTFLGTLFLLIFSVFTTNIAHAEACPEPLLYEVGKCCSTVGETHLDEKSTAILACLFDDESQTSQTWKNMVGSAASTPQFDLRDFKLVTSRGPAPSNTQAPTPLCPSGMVLVNRIGVSSHAFYTDVGLCVTAKYVKPESTAWPLNYCGQAAPGGGNYGVECP